MDKQKYWFFGSKLNTALLLVLIILMVIALKWMHENKETYKNTGFYDSLTSEDNKVFEDASIPTPALHEMVGADGLPLANFYTKNGLTFEYNRNTIEKTLNGSFGIYHEIGLPPKDLDNDGVWENYYPDTVHFFRGVVPKDVNMCDPSHHLEIKTTIINNKTLTYCNSNAEPYVQYVYKKDGGTVLIGTMLIADEKMKTYIDLGSIEIK